MIAGKLRYMLQLLKPTKSVDEFGAECITFALNKTAHAERVKQSGSESRQVGEMFPDYRAEFNIRIEHEIEEHWRVQQQGGYLYNVVSIIPNIERGYKTLICERVNE